jgi:ATP-binding cassette subfamily B protein
MKTQYNALLQLLRIAKPPKGKIVFAALCSLLNKLCDIVPEILIGISIDVIVNQQNSVIAKFGIPNPYHQLYLVAFLTAILWILESVFEYLYAIAWRGLAHDVQHTLRLKTYTHLQQSDLAYFENKTTGGLLSIIQDDINQLEQFLSQGPNEIIQLTVNIVAMGALFLYISPAIAFTAIMPIPFVIGIAYYYQHKLAKLYAQVRETTGSLASHIAYRLQGITTIKSYTTEQYEIARLEKESAQFQKAHHEASRVNAEYVPVVRMGIMVGFIASLVVGGMYALQGYIPINWFAALVFLTQRFLWPFTSLTTITDMYERAQASARRIMGVLECSPTILDGKNHLALNTVKGKVSFENVGFAYNNGKRIFNNLSLEIPAGTTAAFVGTTGSGKSTIIKLLLRFYDANQGTIAIDGTDIKSITLDDLRASIGLVSQDVYIVDGTIADNIAYGTFGAQRDAIIGAAKMAQAHDFIMALPAGYETIMQENGKNLSGGQRQRISIARAIIKKSPILIFDEATSAVDNETEAAIQGSMAKLAQDHTMILVAHRLSTVRNAHTIYVLEHGTIIEAGSHDALLQKNGAYAKLWSIQQGK